MAVADFALCSFGSARSYRVARVGVGKVDVFHYIYRSVSHILAPQELADRLSRAPKEQMCAVNAIFCENGTDIFLRSVAVGSLDGSAAEVGTHGIEILLVEHLCEIYLANHCRQHVTCLEIEVVVGPVEVGGHHGDIVGAILQIETFAQLQPGNFCDSVRLVGVFERRGEQCAFGNGLHGIARINAGASKEKKLLHAVAETLADDILLDLQVLVDEIGAVDAVSHDSAHVCGSENHIFGLLGIEELAHSYGVEQIELGVCAAYQVGIAFFLEVVPNCRTHESAVTGNIDF